MGKSNKYEEAERILYDIAELLRLILKDHPEYGDQIRSIINKCTIQED